MALHGACAVIDLGGFERGAEVAAREAFALRVEKAHLLARRARVLERAPYIAEQQCPLLRRLEGPARLVDGRRGR